MVVEIFGKLLRKRYPVGLLEMSRMINEGLREIIVYLRLTLNQFPAFVISLEQAKTFALLQTRTKVAAISKT